MKIIKNKIPSFDDLLFESRNKEYGAYQLRKKYNSVVIGGILFASILVSTAVLLPFFLNRPMEHVLSGGSSYVQVRMDNLPPPQEQLYIPPTPPPPEPKSAREIVRYVPPVVVDSIIPIDKSLVSTDEVIAHSDNQKESENTGHGSELLYGEVGSGDGDAYFLLEVLPSFRGGGIDKFREWIGRRIITPQEAIEKKINGTVYLTFIVEKDGSVSNVTVVKGVDPLVDSVSVKTIKESPKWSPGLQRGQPVRVRFQIPLRFI